MKRGDWMPLSVIGMCLAIFVFTVAVVAFGLGQ